MDGRLVRDGFSLKSLSLNVLCFYATAYPCVAHFFMTGTEAGTLVVQVFQTAPILALAYLWKFRVKTRSLKSYVDVWTISLVYFTCAASYFALFYASENQFAEIVYSARFLSWFWLAATLRRVVIEPMFWERLAKSFWLGATSQCFIALWGALWGLGNGVASTYSNVEATTGSANVSGKTVVAFVVLGIALSAYWFWVKRRFKLLYLATGIAGIAVVLHSYNRASQLGLAVAYCCVFLACLRKKRFKAAGAMLGALLILAAFITSNYGSRFAARWETVVADRGSGRLEMIEIAGRSLADPPSAAVFWFGRGVYQTKEMMYEEIGSYIGMHNDVLDFAIVYGAAGVGLWLWAIYTILSFHKFAPRYAVEKYFVSAASVFIVLTGLFTGLFQATYVYFMLIATQYYFISQARVKRARWEEGVLTNEAVWDGANWELDEDADGEDWEESEEESEDEGADWGRAKAE